MASARPEGGGQAQREDRHIGRTSRSDAAPTSTRRWPARRRPPAAPPPADPEHPHQHHEAQRDRDRLHQQHVPLGLGVDLRVHHRRAARAAPSRRGVRGSTVAEMSSTSAWACSGAVFSPPVIPASTRPERPSRLTSSADAGGFVVHADTTPTTSLLCLHAGDDLQACGARGSAVSTVGIGHGEDQLLVALAEYIGEDGGRTGRLRGRVLESAARSGCLRPVCRRSRRRPSPARRPRGSVAGRLWPTTAMRYSRGSAPSVPTRCPVRSLHHGGCDAIGPTLLRQRRVMISRRRT